MDGTENRPETTEERRIENGNFNEIGLWQSSDRGELCTILHTLYEFRWSFGQVTDQTPSQQGQTELSDAIQFCKKCLKDRKEDGIYTE